MATFGISADGSLIPPIQRLADDPRKVAGKLGRREGLTEVILGCAFLAAASVLAAVLPWERSLDAAAAALLVLLYAAASRVHLEDGTGHTDPTQVVLVPMLYFLPCPVVPLAVAAGHLVGNLPELLTGRMHPSRAVLSLGNSWYAIAPALVFTLGAAGDPDLSDWPLLVAALGAQFALDFVITALREWAGLGVSPRFQPRLLAWVYLTDACLAPLGLLSSLIIVEEPLALLLLVPLPVLVVLYAREREESISGALELSQAYRGTADLLGDVLEADDEYTANHSRSVVELAVQVADKMALDAEERRRVEFAALLHDVGKIAVPDEIVNKPEALTDEEWHVMQTHTVRGQEFLAKVGGVFGEVGDIVRASHERWDGLGYPDRLSGPSIPLAARIVSCCDAFNAMTTERPYRLAMSQEVALRELVDNAGTQFDPHVVRTLIAVVRRSVYTPLPELRSSNGDGRFDSAGARSS
jgi:HD-GYP domain-containing protein (c-di-GMP phosphodiesterase class II)